MIAELSKKEIVPIKRFVQVIRIRYRRIIGETFQFIMSKCGISLFDA